MTQSNTPYENAKKTVKLLSFHKRLFLIPMIISLVGVMILTHTDAQAENFIADTHGPAFIAPLIHKEFRGAVSPMRKNVPTRLTHPWYGFNNTDEQSLMGEKSKPASTYVRSAQAQESPQPMRTSRGAAMNASAQSSHVASIMPHKQGDPPLPSSLETGLSAGSALMEGNASRSVALMPMYKDFLMYGITNNPIDSNYMSNLGGVSAVANIALDNIMRVGIAFDVGIGHTSFVGDHYHTENIYDFWGISLFAGYNFENIGLLFDVGYASEYSDVEQIKSANMLKGNLDSDFGAATFTAGMRTEYRMETDLLTIAPHMGVRYTSTNFDAHTVYDDAQTLSAWTIPIGITLSKNIETYSGWALVPSLDVGFVATLGDLKATASMPSTANFSNFDMQAIDDFAFDGGLGLSLVKDGISVDVNYNVQLSPKGAGHLVSGSLRFEF